MCKMLKILLRKIVYYYHILIGAYRREEEDRKIIEKERCFYLFDEIENGKFDEVWEMQLKYNPYDQMTERENVQDRFERKRIACIGKAMEAIRPICRKFTLLEAEQARIELNGILEELKL